MKTSSPLVVGLSLVAITFLTGCEDIESRIKEKMDAFSQLSPEAQARIRNQNIALGDSADMVYIALGKPNATEKATGASGPTEILVYKNVPSSSPAVALANNQPGARYQPSRESNQAPRNETSMASTKGGGPMQGLEISDAATHTLYIGVVNGKVAALGLQPIDAKTL